MRSINWAYQQEPGPWTGGRSIYAPRGKTLGGSSSINGHIYNRGQRRISTPGRNSAIAAGAIRTCCRTSSGWNARHRRGRRRLSGARGQSDRHRRSTGKTRSARPSSPARSASASRAIPTTTARCRKACLRAAHHPERPAHQRRDSVPASGDEAAQPHVRTHAHATEIVFDGKRAVGVRYIKGGRGGSADRGARQQGSDPVPAARTTRRSCCSSPASGRRPLLHRSASRCAMRCRASARTCGTTTRRASSRG